MHGTMVDIGKSAGVPNFNPRTIRKSFIVRKLAEGLSLNEISLLIGIRKDNVRRLELRLEDTKAA